MQKTMISNDEILDFIDVQLRRWPLAKKNYDDIASVRRRDVTVGSLRMALQCNPARMVSTGADLSKEVVAKRRCFLCASNRPPEQMAVELVPGWELCVNPFPIFPVHFTVISKSHRPQDRVPYETVSAVEALPQGMAVFFNGAKAGASAPDHLHMQAVLKDELPVLRLAETMLPPDGETGFAFSNELFPGLPFVFATGIVRDESDLKILSLGLTLGGPDAEGKLTDPEKVNTFFWKDSCGFLRFVSIPRTCHRPRCYFEEGDAKRIVSPGCIDMAGVMILPRECDFESITPGEIMKIYSETALCRL